MSEKKKKLPHIHVDEVRNGYVLAVGGREFMTFSPEGLLSEIFYRVGCQETDWCDRTFVENIVEAAGAWPTMKEAITAIATQKDITESVRQDLRFARREIASLTEERDQLTADKKKLAVKLLNAERERAELGNTKHQYDKVFKLYQTECAKTIKQEAEMRELRMKIREMEARTRRGQAVKETRKKRTREQIAEDNFSDRATDTKRPKL